MIRHLILLAFLAAFASFGTAPSAFADSTKSSAKKASSPPIPSSTTPSGKSISKGSNGKSPSKQELGAAAVLGVLGAASAK